MDLIIAGGGITALSIAWEAVCRGMQVAVVHRPRQGAASHAKNDETGFSQQKTHGYLQNDQHAVD